VAAGADVEHAAVVHRRLHVALLGREALARQSAPMAGILLNLGHKIERGQHQGRCKCAAQSRTAFPRR
jgi:hypothetical protein